MRRKIQSFLLAKNNYYCYPAMKSFTNGSVPGNGSQVYISDKNWSSKKRQHHSHLQNLEDKKMSKMLFVGNGPALITPFGANGKIDRKAYQWLINSQIKEGTSFLVPCGTTGESPGITTSEHVMLVKYCVQCAKGRVPVLAGTGSNSTAEAVYLTKQAKAVGASGALVVGPYYNKPMAKGFLDYYRKIAVVGLPVILYDIPGRTAKGVPTDVILQLAKEGSIAGIKWASGDQGQLMDIIINRPSNFTVLSGDDNLTYTLLALGGHGVISVLSNVLPNSMSRMVSLAKNSGFWEEAREIHYELLPLMRAMFLETNPQPVKTALSLMYPSVFNEHFRSPMMPMEPHNKAKLVNILLQHDLIEG